MRSNLTMVEVKLFKAGMVALTLIVWICTPPTLGEVLGVVDMNMFPHITVDVRETVTAPPIYYYSTSIHGYRPRDRELYWTLAKSRAVTKFPDWTLTKSRAVTTDANRRLTFGDYCKAWIRWENDNCVGVFDIQPPRVAYCDTSIQRRWSVWAKAVNAERYSGGLLAVVFRNGPLLSPFPVAGALLVDPEQQDGNYTVLIRGHSPWGEESVTERVVYLPTPQYPGRWCRVWASGSSLIVSHGQNYTLVHTAEGKTPSIQSAGLLLPHLRGSYIGPKDKCSSFWFPRDDLRRVDATVVECGGKAFQSLLNPGALPPNSYFCAELEQDLAFVSEGVGYKFWAGAEWDVERMEPDLSWPIFCQNWTIDNSLDGEGDGDGSYLLAGFLRYLKEVGGKVFAVFTYFDIHQI